MTERRMNMKTTRRDLLSGQFGPDGAGMTIPELAGQASTIMYDNFSPSPLAPYKNA